MKKSTGVFARLTCSAQARTERARQTVADAARRVSRLGKAPCEQLQAAGEGPAASHPRAAVFSGMTRMWVAQIVSQNVDQPFSTA
jgi:hypothetical protein